MIDSAMSALYLPGVESNLKPGTYKDLIDSARGRQAEYSKIWDLFAFQPSFTGGLSTFTQGVLRAPATISPAMREPIAAWTSSLNECRFCTRAHAAAAAELLGSEELLRSVLSDLESSPLPERDKAMLRFVAKITSDLPGFTAADMQSVRAAGWDDEAIYFAITTCALFNFYNRWITATGVAEMSGEAHRQQGRHLARHGYVRDGNG
ncbi:MAG: peroxidase-related enzyme [Bryobacteraceae bacterium]